MTLPSLPTDSLYKFMTVLGLAGVTAAGAMFLNLEAKNDRTVVEINKVIGSNNVEIGHLELQLEFHDPFIEAAVDAGEAIVFIQGVPGDPPDMLFEVSYFVPTPATQRNNLERWKEINTLLFRQAQLHTEVNLALRRHDSIGKSSNIAWLYLGLLSSFSGAFWLVGFRFWYLRVQRLDDELRWRELGDTLILPTPKEVSFYSTPRMHDKVQ